jgi:CheY-like chemotaxis protein
MEWNGTDASSAADQPITKDGIMASILVIDDDAQFRKMLCKLLEKDGHAVVEASGGQEGIQRYRRSPTDLVITDIVMPDKEGIETIIELRRQFSDVKIIAMSGGGQIGPDSYLDLAQKLGACQTLTKPVDRQALRSAIENVLAAAC